MAMRAARPFISITHTPDCTLVTDPRNSKFASFR